MKTQGGGQVRTNTPEELKLAGRFVQSGFTEGQARLKAVWENPQIASICSQMPSMALLSQNTAAAMNRARLSAGEREMLDQHARASAAGYCAGCTGICEPALAASVPVGRVMRYLMYGQKLRQPGLRPQPVSVPPGANPRRHGPARLHGGGSALPAEDADRPADAGSGLGVGLKRSARRVRSGTRALRSVRLWRT